MMLPSSVHRALENLYARSRSTARSARSLASNEYFWAGFALFFLVLFGLYVLVDRVLLPEYTRHDVTVQVPNVMEQPFDEAEAILSTYNLRAERVSQRYNPDLPHDVVMDQEPADHSLVKPGRRIYLTVNAGETPMIYLPNLEGMSLREARNRVQGLGLEIEDELSDSIPSPYRNTITRHEPAAGDSLAEGSSVTLWYSTGLGDAYVSVPDVTGLGAEEAKDELLQLRLRSVIVRPSNGVEDDEDDEEELVVLRQSREPGTRVREGFEIRLFLGEPPEEEVEDTTADMAEES